MGLKLAELKKKVLAWLIQQGLLVDPKETARLRAQQELKERLKKLQQKRQRQAI